MDKSFSDKVINCNRRINFSFIDAVSDFFGKRDFKDENGFRLRYNKIDENQVKNRVFYYVIPIRDGRYMLFGPYASEGFAKVSRNIRRFTTFLDIRVQKPSAVMNGKELKENYPDLFMKAQILATPLEYIKNVGE